MRIKTKGESVKGLSTIEVGTYTRIPESKQREFWSKGKIEHIRQLSVTGRAHRVWTPKEELSNRPLDRLSFEERNVRLKSDIDTSVELAYGRIGLSTPLYLGDMSYGALSGIANIALARTADITGILTGTGEGGLNSEVMKSRRITIQWASARFGVDMNVLSSGMGIVIKIGQGAKPGIGGHLPASKVTEPISVTRRIPIGRDAISPAPHHDIYSIEDLEQRIWGLKEATGKPIFVKVGVTNYIPYIASGIARMGADGIIMDASGAGTGAAPSVVKDNVGLPIELAVASVDAALRKENLREGFSIIAAGRVSNAEDTAKLMALGADCVSVGTGALISMGCLMVHKCHIGFCPALITNKITPNPAKVLSMEKAVEWTVNLVRGWTEELALILKAIGVKSARELVGRRDLLVVRDMNHETRSILGIVSADDYAEVNHPYSMNSNLWTDSRRKHLQELAGTTGKSGGEAVISSMGTVGPPFVELPSVVCDWLVCDGAQVTRPSIDPYREPIETASHIGRYALRLSSPFFFAPLRRQIPDSLLEVFAKVASSMGLLMHLESGDYADLLERYSGRLMSSVDTIDDKVPGGTLVLVSTPEVDVQSFKDRFGGRLLYAHLPSSEASIKMADKAARKGFDGIVLDADLPSHDPLDLAIATAEIDTTLRSVLKGSVPLRNCLDLVVEGSVVRGAEDVFKLMALGADIVGFSTAALIGIGYEEDVRPGFDPRGARYRLENLIFGLQKEIKLLAGAAGISSMHTSLVGSRELLRAVDLDPNLRKRLGVKPAGIG